MNFEGIIGGLNPRVSSKIISAVIAFALTVAGVRGYGLITAAKEGESEDSGGNNGSVQTGADADEVTKQEEKLFTENGAINLSGETGAEAALLCNMSKMNIIAQKNNGKVINCGDISVFATALLVSRAIDNGKISEDDYAVCPASAQKRANYSFSSSVLSVGKKMTVRDILRCMIYQRGSSFAYTLAVHISGSEEAFVSELNALAASLSMTGTAFTNVCGEDDGVAKTTAYDAAVLLRAFLNDSRLRKIFCSSERITLKNGDGQSSIYLTVANDFFVSSCTESQARADGISGGKTGSLGDGGWAVVLFSGGDSEYMIITLNCQSPYSEALKIYAAYL